MLILVVADTILIAKQQYDRHHEDRRGVAHEKEKQGSREERSSSPFISGHNNNSRAKGEVKCPKIGRKRKDHPLQ